MPEAPTPMSAFVRRNDEGVESLLERQNTDPESRWRGAIAGPTGLHEAGTASGVLISGVAAYHHPDSKYYRDAGLRRRLHLAADHLTRVQTADGNFDLLITNFNSPPDTAFIMRNVASAAYLANKNGDRELFGWMEPSMQRGADGLLKGGIHTPNHRWVACAALAQLQEVLKRPELIKRVDEWLMEGIDIDEDGQYSEQSTAGYNAHVDNCLVTVADKLKRPELFEPVRRNLETMLYLLHPNFEVVTEISHRQDRNTIGDMGTYWFALRYMAREDKNGQFETVARAFEPERGSLPLLMEYPQLQADMAAKPVPDDYSKHFEHSNLVHIRRGKTSASIIPKDNSRFFAVRRGDAVVSGVRFAASFFGKGQFIPTEASEKNGVWTLEQHLEGPYFQPFGDGRKQPWGVDKWYELRTGREQTEVAKFHYTAEVKELENGFDVRVKAEGTDWVPLAIEINLRPGGEILGVTPAPGGVEDAFLLESGYATYRREGDELTFGPGMAETGYTQVRGAEEKLSGPSVYITGYTPFDRTVEFRWR
jgi:hypothetical protein